MPRLSRRPFFELYLCDENVIIIIRISDYGYLYYTLYDNGLRYPPCDSYLHKAESDASYDKDKDWIRIEIILWNDDK